MNRPYTKNVWTKTEVIWRKTDLHLTEGFDKCLDKKLSLDDQCKCVEEISDPEEDLQVKIQSRPI